MSEHRDRVVGDALRRLDVPDHEPGFWAALDARIAADDGPEHLPTPPTADKETTVVDLDSTRSARRRTPALALAAAVAIVVALVAGVALLGDDGDGDSQLDVADPTETSVPEDTSTTEPREDPTTTTTPPQTTTTMQGRQAAPEEAASEWLDALAAGQMDAAYDLLDEQSKADLTRSEFADLSSGLSEGAAAFADDDIDRSTTEFDGFAVVTFAGDVEREGMVETAAYPVVVTASGVHFTLDGPQVDLDPEYAQSSGSTLAAPLELVVQEETDAWIWVDDGDAEPLAGRGSVRVDVEAEAGAGTHVVSVVATQAGRVTARSYTVVVP